MAKIKGICRNIDECELAANKEVQEVEKSDFVCQECGRPLYPIEERKKRSNNNNRLFGIIAAAVVLLAIIIGCILGLRGGFNEQKESADDVPTVIDTADVATPLVEKADTVVVRDTIVQTDTITIREKVETNVTKITTSQQDNTTLHLSYGNYTGSTKNGYPHGQGKLTYTKSRQINRNDIKKRKANAGEYVIGEFFNGFVVYGKLYDVSGNLLSTLNYGVGSESSYESK